MLPMGGTKGAMLALVVELLVTALTGAAMGFEASSFFVDEGNRPRLGQAFLVIDPTALAGRDAYLDRVETLIAAMLEDEGVRLPGSRRDALAARAAERRASRFRRRSPTSFVAARTTRNDYIRFGVSGAPRGRQQFPQRIEHAGRSRDDLARAQEVDPPAKSPTRPPASLISNAPAATSHGFRLVTQKPSRRPAAT